MANTLDAVVPKILAQGLLALRENTVMPALVNNSYGSEASQKGAAINVPIPSAIAAQDVVPNNTAPVTAATVPTEAVIQLDQWKEAPFYLTDQDMTNAEEGIIPMQASEAIKSIANAVDQYLLGLYTGVSGWQGVAGATPFASNTSDATGARKVLNKQLAPLVDRRFVLDPDAEANALDLRAFQDMSFTGSAAAIVEGQLNRKLGFDWFMDQNIPTHVAGTLAGTTGTGKALVNNAGVAVGDTSIDVDDTALTGTVVVGDVFSVAGDAQTYTVTEAATASSNAVAGLKFSPAAQVAWADDAVMTFKGDHVVNLAFHRDAFAFASRPLADQTDGLGNIIQSVVDPVSGLSLRLEVSREHKRTRFAYDILFGAELVRSDLAARVAG